MFFRVYQPVSSLTGMASFLQKASNTRNAASPSKNSYSPTGYEREFTLCFLTQFRMLTRCGVVRSLTRYSVPSAEPQTVTSRSNILSPKNAGGFYPQPVSTYYSLALMMYLPYRLWNSSKFFSLVGNIGRLYVVSATRAPITTRFRSYPS